MKKSLFLFLTLFIVGLNGCTQDKTTPTNLKENVNCDYGKRPHYGWYDSDYYSKFNSDSFDIIRTRLDKYSKMSLNELRQGYDYYLYSLIMRSKDINWGDKQEIILAYLHNYAKTILDGKSYLNKENRNVLFDERGCGFHMEDALFVPQDCYWAILGIDKAFFSKSLSEIWGKLLIDELYSNQMRQFLLREIEKNHKDKEIQVLIENLHHKYKSQKLFPNESKLIQDLIDKKIVAKTKSQSEVWADLVKKSKLYNYEVLSQKNQDLWIENINYMIDIFDNCKVETPLNMAENERDFKTKYYLTYCSCCLINQKQPKKVDAKLIQRIDKLVLEINKKYASFNKEKKIEYGILNMTYKAMKKRY
jgi:hypothetical protein